MPFVKLDCGILQSTVWFDKDARTVFLTALLMAEPFELHEQTEQIEIRSLNGTGWFIPPGWYGMVPAASVGILARAQVDLDPGFAALERLGSAEPDSRSKEFDGRRLVRVDGGFIVLNYDKYRQRDYTSAERSRRYRERKASRSDFVTSRVISRKQKQKQKQKQKAENGQQTSSADADARSVLDYWKEKTATAPRSERIIEATLKRIRARMKDGCSVVDLKRAVDVACWDQFYREREYHKQPAVIWRNAERVQSLLLKWEREASRPVPL